MVSSTSMLKTLTATLPAEKPGFFPKKSLVLSYTSQSNSQLPIGKWSRMSCLNLSEQNRPFLLHFPNLFCVFSHCTMPTSTLRLIHSLHPIFHQGLVTFFRKMSESVFLSASATTPGAEFCPFGESAPWLLSSGPGFVFLLTPVFLMTPDTFLG